MLYIYFYNQNANKQYKTIFAQTQKALKYAHQPGTTHVTRVIGTCKYFCKFGDFTSDKRVKHWKSKGYGVTL